MPTVNSAGQFDARGRALDRNFGNLGSSPSPAYGADASDLSSVSGPRYPPLKLGWVKGAGGFHFLYQLCSGCPQHSVEKRSEAVL